MVDIDTASVAAFSDDIATLIMFRAMEKDEQVHGQTLTTYRNQGVVLNTERYRPTRNITRAEFVKMLVRSLACHYTYLGKDTGFADVSPSSWYAEYIALL